MGCQIKSLVCFNSTMVRLVAGIDISEKTIDQFQFHYGTIGRKLKPDIISGSKRCFNSTMVRLVG